MILDLSPADITVIAGAVTAVCGTGAAVIQHLYASREADRKEHIATVERYTAAMLDVAEKLRLEGEKEIAELRDEVKHYSSPEFRAPPRRKAK